MFMFHVEHGVGNNMDEKKLLMAFEEAKKAYELNETPVGCVIFKEDEIVGCGYNKKESESNAILHAEMIAIDEACKFLNSWRLDDCIMYVTLEPCMMCMGAIVESRIKTVYYGTKNNNEQLYDINKVKKRVCLIDMEDKNCSRLLTEFFKKRRKK